MQIHDAELPRGHGVAVGHGHHRNFLQAEDILKPPIANERVIERHFGRAGIAENMPHAEACEQVEEGLNSAECHPGIVPAIEVRR